jgi:hypothetical protein
VFVSQQAGATDMPSMPVIIRPGKSGKIAATVRF